MTDARIITDAQFSKIIDDLRDTATHRLAAKWRIDLTEEEITWLDDSITAAIRDIFIIEDL